ncbi:MAG: hypothetical protein EOO59_04670 [Hymenobacter sp.]|nr:MAG: hypothetical protein EOO59_04670 [Hymenobacter sp.]
MAKKPPLSTTALTAKALGQGKQHATRALKRRNDAIETRQAALVARTQHLGAVALVAAPLPPAQLAALGSPTSAGVLVAEGDSWFDYPLHDVLTLLEDAHGYEVESVAHRGDQVESMAYREGQLDDFIRRIDKVLRRGLIPHAILLSGGGNDIAGSEFYMLLDDARSAAPGLNAAVVDGVINQRIRLAYVAILSAVTRVCEQRLQRTIPILVHGYDYPVPDGRGFLGGWGPLPGPWLAPGFAAKGYGSLAVRKQLVKDLIDRFNEMLARVAALPAFASHVRYVDLRGTLPTGADYREWWSNELHPSPGGFARVAERFAQVLAPAAL